MVKVNAEKLPDSQVHLTIEVEPERVQQSFDTTYKRVAGTVNVPGFRRGKAPRVLLERFIGKDNLRRERMDRLINEVFVEAVKQAGLSPIRRPDFQYDENYELGPPLTITTTVQVEPTIELGDYQGIRLSPVGVGVTAEQVNESVERLRESSAEFDKVDRGGKKGDFVTIDVKGTTGQFTRLYGLEGQSLVKSGEGNVLFDEKDHRHLLDDSSDAEFAPGFAEQLVGAKAGETRRFELSLPADYHNKELASKAVSFEVTVHGVSERHLPKLDDEFAKKVSKFETVEQLRDQIKQALLARMEAEARDSYHRSLIDALIEVSTVETPPAMVEHELEHQLDTFKSALMRQNQSYEDYLSASGRSDEVVRNELRERAARALKSSLALEALADAENVTVGDEEIEQEIKLQARRYPERLRSYFEDRMGKGKAREEIAFQLRSQKTVERLAEVASGTRPASGQPEDKTDKPAAEPEASIASEQAAASAATTVEDKKSSGEEAKDQ